MKPNFCIICGAVAAAVVAVSAAFARDITGLTLSQSAGGTVAGISMTAGEEGDSHVLYVAYGARDFGDTLYAWAHGGGG